MPFTSCMDLLLDDVCCMYCFDHRSVERNRLEHNICCENTEREKERGRFKTLPFLFFRIWKFELQIHVYMWFPSWISADLLKKLKKLVKKKKEIDRKRSM